MFQYCPSRTTIKLTDKRAPPPPWIDLSATSLKPDWAQKWNDRGYSPADRPLGSVRRSCSFPFHIVRADEQIEEAVLVVPAILSQSTNQIAAFPFSTSTVPPNRGKTSTRSRSVDSLSVCEPLVVVGVGGLVKYSCASRLYHSLTNLRLLIMDRFLRNWTPCYDDNGSKKRPPSSFNATHGVVPSSCSSDAEGLSGLNWGGSASPIILIEGTHHNNFVYTPGRVGLWGG